MSQYMHSIPPKQFAIFSGVPHIFSPIINQLQRGWQRCRLIFKQKGVGGIIFLAQKGRFPYGNTPPSVFLIKG